MCAMTDELREYLRPSAFEVLEYFSNADLQRRLEKDGCTKNMVSKVLNGFRTNQKTVREIAELPDDELKRPNWTGSTAFKLLNRAILGLLRDGWS